MRSFQNSQPESLVGQNSPSRHLFLPFPLPSASDASLATPIEFWSTSPVALFRACLSDMAQCPHHVLSCAERYNSGVSQLPNLRTYPYILPTQIKRFQPRALLPERNFRGFWITQGECPLHQFNQEARWLQGPGGRGRVQGAGSSNTINRGVRRLWGRPSR